MRGAAAFLGLLLPLAATAAPRLEYVTFGIMLHWNFGESEFRSFSYGLEAAYWSFEKDPEASGFLSNTPKSGRHGYGLDLGIEADRSAVRLYSEPQVGWPLAGIAGLSAGPVLEIPRSGGTAHLGIQASGWVAALAGLDFRYRRMDGKNHQAVGLMGKWGALISGAD